MNSKPPIKANVVILTMEELLDELDDFYTSLVESCASDMVRNGRDTCFPFSYAILERGLNNMTLAEIIESSSTWVDITFDSQEDIDIIILQAEEQNIILGNRIDAREKQSEASENSY